MNGIFKFNNNRKTITGVRDKTISSIIIPDYVTGIGKSVFAGCTSLTSVTIPDSVQWIGRGAFENCHSIETINIPNYCIRIGENAFKGCWGLTSVDFPKTMIEVGLDAFADCRELTTIICRSEILNNYDPFTDCPKIHTTEIHGKKTNECYYGRDSLRKLIIGAETTEIILSPFNRCKYLTSISVLKDNQRYDSRNNCNAIIETSSNKLIRGCQNTIIPDGITSIGKGAFVSCEGLTTITIPESVLEIEKYALRGCLSLHEIHLSSKECKAIKVNELSFSKDFYNDMCTLYVPKGSEESYRIHPIFGKFKNIVSDMNT